jgi:microcystin-dependent protein
MSSTPNDLLNSQRTALYDISGPHDPSLVATEAAPGTVYKKTVAPVGLWQKLDEGTTTNWAPFATTGGSVTGGANLGLGAIIFAGLLGTIMQFKTLLAGTGISLTPSATDITIAATFTKEVTAVGKDYWGASLPAGYVWANGTTIGDVGSGATGRANADTLALYTELWPATQLAIYTSGGVLTTRGASAASDYAALKALATPNKAGRVSVGSDALGGITAALVSQVTTTLTTTNGSGTATPGSMAGLYVGMVIRGHNTVADGTTIIAFPSASTVSLSAVASGVSSASAFFSSYGNAEAVGSVGGVASIALQTAQIPSHTHLQNAHTHTQDAHSHTQDAHTHTQNSHDHTQAAHNHTHTGAQNTSWVGRNNASAAVGNGGTAQATLTYVSMNNATPTINGTTATNQNTTATNQSTTATNQNTTATNQNEGFGLAHGNMQPGIVCNYIIAL